MVAAAVPPHVAERIHRQFPVRPPEGKGAELTEVVVHDTRSARGANHAIVDTRRRIASMQSTLRRLPEEKAAIERTLRLHDPVRRVAVAGWFAGAGAAVVAIPTLFIHPMLGVKLLAGGLGTLAASIGAYALNDRAAGGDPLDKLESLSGSEDALPHQLDEAQASIPLLEDVRCQAMTAARAAREAWRQELPIGKPAQNANAPATIVMDEGTVRIGSLSIPRKAC